MNIRLQRRVRELEVDYARLEVENSRLREEIRELKKSKGNREVENKRDNRPKGEKVESSGF